MGPFIRSLTAASALPAAAIAAATFSSSSSSSSTSKSPFPTKPYLPLLAPLRSTSAFRSFEPVKDSGRRTKAALYMDSTATDQKPSVAGILPELMTEFMVDMKCEGCVSAVKDNLLKLDGVKSVDVDLSNQVVRVLGSPPVKTMADALEQTGRKARLIGQGNPNDFLVSAAVAEFKGPVIFGVVRIAQVNMELARIEASFSGLSPGRHGWAINEFGDLTRGAESTGKVFNPANISFEKPLGDLGTLEALENGEAQFSGSKQMLRVLDLIGRSDLGTLEALENGEAQFSGSKQMLRVLDLIGRSVVVYGTEDKSDSGIAAAVIARSAGVGENYKKLCTCDGVAIWESR